MKVTKDEIVGLADSLIRERGYNSFSYTDISQPLQIKNASVHYYFPSKSDLGIEVIKRATDKFITDSAGWRTLSYKEQLARFVDNYSGKQQKHSICLAGALSAIHDTLSPEMQQELKNMIAMSLDKLVEILTKGKEKGEFNFSEAPKTKAYLIQSSLIASLLLERVLQNESFQIIKKEILSI